MMLSRIGRSISRSSRSSLFNSTLGCDGYGARIIAPRSTEQGLGFLNAYFSSIGASFSPLSRPNFANYSFARFLSSDDPNKLARREKISTKMAEKVNEVISCHTVDHWKEQFEAGKSSGNLVVIDFTASWCGPCRFISPILSELAKKTPTVLFLKVDVDELKTVAEEYKVDAMPTFVFLKNGEEFERVVGARKDSLLELVAKHSASSSAETAAPSSAI